MHYAPGERKKIPTERLATKCTTSFEPHTRGEADKGAKSHFAHINTTEDGRSSIITWCTLLSWYGHTNSAYHHGSVAGRTSLEPHTRGELTRVQLHTSRPYARRKMDCHPSPRGTFPELVRSYQLSTASRLRGRTRIPMGTICITSTLLWV